MTDTYNNFEPTGSNARDETFYADVALTYGVPSHMVEGLARWIVNGVPGGDFMMAMLEGRLFDALGRADSANQYALMSYAKFLYNKAPAGCFGSPESVKAWKEVKGLRGLEDSTNPTNEV